MRRLATNTYALLSFILGLISLCLGITFFTSSSYVLLIIALPCAMIGLLLGIVAHHTPIASNDKSVARLGIIMSGIAFAIAIFFCILFAFIIIRTSHILI